MPEGEWLPCPQWEERLIAVASGDNIELLKQWSEIWQPVRCTIEHPLALRIGDDDHVAYQHRAPNQPLSLHAQLQECCRNLWARDVAMQVFEARGGQK